MDPSPPRRNLSKRWAELIYLDGGGNRLRREQRGEFLPLDAGNGKPLWDFQTGGAVRSNPISFLIDGKQHVAIAAGFAILVFGHS